MAVLLDLQLVQCLLSSDSTPSTAPFFEDASIRVIGGTYSEKSLLLYGL